jgi:hypothetical protein
MNTLVCVDEMYNGHPHYEFVSESLEKCAQYMKKIHSRT